MRPYWIVFYDRTAGTVEAPTLTDALKEATRFGKVMNAQVLPYPATPILVGNASVVMCFSPERCKGFTSCRRPVACSE